MAFAAPLAGRIFASTNFSKLKEQSNDPLVSRVVALATAINCQLAGVDVIEPRDQAQGVSITFMNGRLTLTRKAIDQLSGDALDFGIAYSLQGKPYRLMLTLFPVVILLAGLNTFFIVHRLKESVPAPQRAPASFLSMLLMVVPLIPYVKWITAKEAKRQVRDGLRIVPNRSAAIEWFEASMQPTPGMGNPGQMIKFRGRALANVDEVSREFGIS
jgi:hypothetical protein